MCDYCDVNSFKTITLDSSDRNYENYFSSFLDNNNNLTIQHYLNLGFLGNKKFISKLKINYCPICGEKL